MKRKTKQKKKQWYLPLMLMLLIKLKSILEKYFHLNFEFWKSNRTISAGWPDLFIMTIEKKTREAVDTALPADHRKEREIKNIWILQKNSKDQGPLMNRWAYRCRRSSNSRKNHCKIIEFTGSLRENLTNSADNISEII